MASLQIRDLPDDVYESLSHRASKEGRSLAQQAIVELRKVTKQVRTGVRWSQMDKTCVFDPERIEQPGYGPGRHSAQPCGEIRYPESRELVLLHYKYLGAAYLISRLSDLRPGFGPGDRARNFGHKYFWSRDEAIADFEAVRATAGVVLSVDGRVETTET